MGRSCTLLHARIDAGRDLHSIQQEGWPANIDDLKLLLAPHAETELFAGNTTRT